MAGVVGILTALSSVNQETTPLLAGETVRRYAPYLPQQTAERIGMYNIGGSTVSSALNYGQLLYYLQNLRSPITNDRMWDPTWDILARDETHQYGKPPLDKSEIPRQQSQGHAGVAPTTKIIVPSNVGVRTQNVFGNPIQKTSDFVNGYNNRNKESDLAVSSNGTISNAFNIGKDLGSLIALVEQELFKGLTESEAYMNVMSKYPNLAYLIQDVTEYINYKPKGDLLAQLNEYRRLYDGNDMRVQNCFYDADGDVGIKTQRQGVIVYKGKRGNSPVPRGMVFFGPNSPNNRLPYVYNDGLISTTGILDCIALAHDWGFWKYGYFHLESTLIFCARILNQMNNMTAYEQQLGKMAVHYFLTFGNSIELLRANLPDNINERPVSSTTNDISATLYGRQLPPQQRSMFWDGVLKGAETLFGASMSPPTSSGYLLSLFDTILVDEVSNFEAEGVEPVQEEVPPPPVLQQETNVISTTTPIVNVAPPTTTPETSTTSASIPIIPYETPIASVA